jgi:hypothetical protein
VACLTRIDALIERVDPHKKKYAVVAIDKDPIVRAEFIFMNSGNGFEKALEKARVEMVKNG